VNLSDKLLRIVRDGAPERSLDLYNLQRRTVAIEFVQEQSIANKTRLEARDPAVRRRNLDELRASAADPERARQFLLRTSMIASQRRAEAMALADCRFILRETHVHSQMPPLRFRDRTIAPNALSIRR
jgi:hypothetical protein